MRAVFLQIYICKNAAFLRGKAAFCGPVFYDKNKTTVTRVSSLTYHQTVKLEVTVVIALQNPHISSSVFSAPNVRRPKVMYSVAIHKTLAKNRNV